MCLRNRVGVGWIKAGSKPNPRKMLRSLLSIAALAVLMLGTEVATAQRSASPRGEAATQIGDHWITVDYGRPILRGRTGIFGEGESWGATVTGNAPVWRLGANKSTRLMTEVDLQFGSEMLPAGEYSLFVEFGPGQTDLIVSSHGAKESGRDSVDGLWGAYNYTDDKDVLRMAMEVETLDVSFDQLTISFIDVTSGGGRLAVLWGGTALSIPFTVSG